MSIVRARPAEKMPPPFVAVNQRGYSAVPAPGLIACVALGRLSGRRPSSFRLISRPLTGFHQIHICSQLVILRGNSTANRQQKFPVPGSDPEAFGGGALDVKLALSLASRLDCVGALSVGAHQNHLSRALPKCRFDQRPDRRDFFEGHPATPYALRHPASSLHIPFR